MDELSRIKSGFVQSQVLKCRELLSDGKKETYTSEKQKLPSVTFSGVFLPSRKIGDLVSYTSLIIIDVDKIEESELQQKKCLVFEDPIVMACWVSPSGIGLKILIECASTPTSHKFYYDSLVKYLSDKYDLLVDVSGSDIPRLCYTSYDVELLYKADNKVYTIDVNTFALEQQSQIQRRIVGSQDVRALHRPIGVTERRLLFGTEGKNNPMVRKIMKYIIIYCKKNGISLTNSYDNWYKAGFAIASVFSYDVGLKYYLKLCELDGVGYHREKCISMLQYCYRNIRPNGITFGTLIHFAKQKGFVIIKRRSKLKLSVTSSPPVAAILPSSEN